MVMVIVRGSDSGRILRDREPQNGDISGDEYSQSDGLLCVVPVQASIKRGKGFPVRFKNNVRSGQRNGLRKCMVESVQVTSLIRLSTYQGMSAQHRVER